MPPMIHCRNSSSLPTTNYWIGLFNQIVSRAES
jgi:hypothetical protein